MVGTSFLIGTLIATTVAGTAISATGQIKAGNAAKRAGEAEAQRDEYNATLADQQAHDALARGNEETARFRTGVRGLIGTQRVAFAGQNVDVDTGSAADVTADAAHLGELDARQIQRNAEREAWGFRNEAADLRRVAGVARLGGQAQATGSRYAAAGTILGGASQAGSLLMARYGWNNPQPNVGALPPAYMRGV